MENLFRWIWKAIALFAIVNIFLILISYVFTPIYDFDTPSPFVGGRIYDPYEGVDFRSDSIRGDSLPRWWKANFHAHSLLPNRPTNGALTVPEVIETYKSYGYDIAAISDYYTLPKPPVDAYTIPVYEHGYNVLKYHQLVFGWKGMRYRDFFLPLTLSRKQHVLNLVGKRADLVTVNHPRFTYQFDPEHMEYLTGYRLIEAAAGMSPAVEWWDAGLSCGHPSFILSGDDSHDVRRPHDIATHCTMVYSPSQQYTDIRDALAAGRHYGMSMPNFGNGDTAVKREAMRHLARLTDIRFEDDTISVAFSKPAESIAFVGQDGKVRKSADDASAAAYRFAPRDTYIRVEAAFPDGERIYLNPYFRYEEDPFAFDPPRISWWLTIVSELCLWTVLGLLVWGAARIVGYRPQTRQRK
ncbi:MAG: hypothetical protein IJC16_01930 [Rikenellaceae bacterium]|nr:hypothetical protein [Rikenellaceae bacterium]